MYIFKWFENDYRSGISYIINRKNNLKLTSDKALIVQKDFGIEIHFKQAVTELQFFFSGSVDKNMYNLLSIDFTNFDSSSVTNMQYMFQSCISLKSINLSNFNTSSVLVMDGIFYGCDSLNYLDISNFDLGNCYSYSNIFSNNNRIQYINMYNFKNYKNISMIFNEINHHFFVCQKDDIIKNPKAQNCCNYNFEENKCNSAVDIFLSNESINNQTNFGFLGINNNSNDEIFFIQKIIKPSKESSNKMLTGVIIVIIIGIITLISMIITRIVTLQFTIGFTLSIINFKKTFYWYIIALLIGVTWIEYIALIVPFIFTSITFSHIKRIR